MITISIPQLSSGYVISHNKHYTEWEKNYEYKILGLLEMIKRNIIFMWQTSDWFNVSPLYVLEGFDAGLPFGLRSLLLCLLRMHDTGITIVGRASLHYSVHVPRFKVILLLYMVSCVSTKISTFNDLLHSSQVRWHAPPLWGGTFQQSRSREEVTKSCNIWNTLIVFLKQNSLHHLDGESVRTVQFEEAGYRELRTTPAPAPWPRN